MMVTVEGWGLEYMARMVALGKGETAVKTINDLASVICSCRLVWSRVASSISMYWRQCLMLPSMQSMLWIMCVICTVID